MEKKEFIYPISYELYSVEEIETIIKHLDLIEQCYINGVSLETYKASYKNFKNIVKSKSEENNLFKDFKEITNYDGYLCTKEMKNEKLFIKL